MESDSDSQLPLADSDLKLPHEARKKEESDSKLVPDTKKNAESKLPFVIVRKRDILSLAEQKAMKYVVKKIYH